MSDTCMVCPSLLRLFKFRFNVQQKFTEIVNVNRWYLKSRVHSFIHSISNSNYVHVLIVSTESLLFVTDTYWRKSDNVWSRFAMSNKVQFCHQTTGIKTSTLIETIKVIDRRIRDQMDKKSMNRPLLSSLIIKLSSETLKVLVSGSDTTVHSKVYKLSTPVSK